tara:strand:+ start:2777 stop:3193 length:417 start_codon:yes stop_codon:yes gene_type:complete
METNEKSKRTSVLYVDDDRELAESVVRGLEQCFDITYFSTSDEAVLCAKEKEPQIVLADLEMYGDKYAGFNLIENIRKNHPNIGPVLYTLNESERIKKRSLDLDITYVSKNTDLNQLIMGLTAANLNRQANEISRRKE